MRSPKTIKRLLSENLSSTINSLYSSDITPDNIQFTYPPNSDLGDFSTNICLQMSKIAKKNPIDLANQVLAKISLPEQIRDAEVLKPGFINFRYKSSYLKDYLFKNTQLEPKQSSGRKVIVEYSQPNIAKPLGVHHILSTVIGASIANILEFRGKSVLRYNYLGDWGTQFGKVIVALKEWGDVSKLDDYTVMDLLNLYVEFHKKAEEDESLNDMARAEHVKLENKDKENLNLYAKIKDISLKDLNRVYDKLGGIYFDQIDSEFKRLESLPELLQEGKKQKIFIPGENGSYIAKFKDPNTPPLVVQKSDGSTLYSTRDIATVKERIKTVDPQRIIYVVDVAQSLHFKQFFEVSKRFSWYSDKTELYHLAFGRMRFPDKKMSTRKGNVLVLEEVLDEAIQRSLDIIQEKNPDLENKDVAAQKIGVGAVKYSILSQSPESNVEFTWSKILSFDGNSGPYLQYSYARAGSILKKNESATDISLSSIKLSQIERDIMHKLFQFRESCEVSSQKLKPNVLANYLYELAQLFNRFYNSSPIQTEEDESLKALRIQIVKQFQSTIKKGLQLLGGIEVLDEM